MTTPVLLSDIAPARARRGLFRQLLHNPLAVVAMVILAVTVVIAVISPWILPFPPGRVELK